MDHLPYIIVHGGKSFLDAKKFGLAIFVVWPGKFWPGDQQEKLGNRAKWDGDLPKNVNGHGNRLWHLDGKIGDPRTLDLI